MKILRVYKNHETNARNAEYTNKMVTLTGALASIVDTDMLIRPVVTFESRNIANPLQFIDSKRVGSL